MKTILALGFLVLFFVHPVRGETPTTPKNAAEAMALTMANFKNYGDLLDQVPIFSKEDLESLSRSLGSDFRARPLTQPKVAGDELVFLSVEPALKIRPSKDNPLLFSVNGKEWVVNLHDDVETNLRNFERITGRKSAAARLLAPDARAIGPWMILYGLVGAGAYAACLVSDKAEHYLRSFGLAPGTGCLVAGFAWPAALILSGMGPSPAYADEAKQMRPVALKCENENSGQLELAGQSSNGVRQTVKVGAPNEGRREAHLVTTDAKGNRKERTFSLDENFKSGSEDFSSLKEYSEACGKPGALKRARGLISVNADRPARPRAGTIPPVRQVE